MNHLIHRHHRTQCAALSLFLATLLGGLPMGLAGESAPPTAPAADPSDVQERAVIRDQRAQPELFQVAPAPAKQIDKSTMGIRDQRTPSVSSPSTTAPSTGGTGPLPVVGGTFEPDYKYPWVVRMNGCGGVLIDPEWVLTAAHCVTPNIGFGKLTYSRTDLYTGAVQTETRAPAPVGSRRDGVYMHPNYAPSNDQANDIALIKLATPFTISPYLQTVGLPRISRNPGIVGTVASAVSHTSTTPTGQLAIFRGPISAIASPTKIFVPASTASASLCPGDSGSGFVTVEYGRATVRGVASQGSVSSCMTPSGEAVFTDVFAFRGWILQTMGKNDPLLTGNTRVRWSGRAARGVMGIGCINPYPYGTLWGPLNVIGVEEGTVCEPGQTQTVMCNLEKNQGNVGVMVPTLSGLTMRTTMANGTSNVQTIPASGNTASFFGLLPAGASREFTCQIATPITGATSGTNAQVLSRGIEGESGGEPTVDQPSPFDSTEETTPKQKEKGQTP